MKVILGLGSNDGDRQRHIEEACEWLATLLGNFRRSDIYVTPPLSGAGPDYMNCVAAGETTLTAEELRSLAKRYELENGRTPEARAAGRVAIDIDVVCAGGNVLRPADFTAPYLQQGLCQLRNVLTF